MGRIFGSSEGMAVYAAAGLPSLLEGLKGGAKLDKTEKAEKGKSGRRAVRKKRKDPPP